MLNLGGLMCYKEQSQYSKFSHLMLAVNLNRHHNADIIPSALVGLEKRSIRNRVRIDL
jgi:hypothetical protein